MSGLPGYWPNETSGVLRLAVEAYLKGHEMTPEQIAAMRAYLRQWIICGDWKGEEVEGLRDLIDSLHSPAQIRNWLMKADEIGIDPL